MQIKQTGVRKMELYVNDMKVEGSAKDVAELLKLIGAKNEPVPTVEDARPTHSLKREFSKRFDHFWNELQSTKFVSIKRMRRIFDNKAMDNQQLQRAMTLRGKSCNYKARYGYWIGGRRK